MADPQPAMVPVDTLVAAFALVQVVVTALVQVVQRMLDRRGEAAKAEADEAEASVLGAKLGEQTQILQDILEILERREDAADADSHMIKDLYDMHKKVDGDGRPVWYFPGSMVSVLKDITASQQETAKVLDGIARQVDRCDARRQRG